MRGITVSVALHMHNAPRKLCPPLTDPQLRKCRPIRERQQTRRQRQTDAIPLLDQRQPMAQHRARLLQRFPQRRRRKAAGARQQPHLEQHAEHALAQFVGDILADDGRRQQALVDGEQEEQQRLPRVTRQALRVLGDFVQRAEHPMAEQHLPMDDVGRCSRAWHVAEQRGWLVNTVCIRLGLPQLRHSEMNNQRFFLYIHNQDGMKEMGYVWRRGAKQGVSKIRAHQRNVV